MFFNFKGSVLRCNPELTLGEFEDGKRNSVVECEFCQKYIVNDWIQNNRKYKFIDDKIHLS